MASPTNKRQRIQAINQQKHQQEALEREGQRASLPVRQEEAFAEAERRQQLAGEAEQRQQQERREFHQQHGENLQRMRENGTLTAAQPGELTERLRHPDQLELNTRLQNCVRALEAECRPKQTSDATDPKIQEHCQFCDCACPSERSNDTPNAEKAHRFFFYVAFRMNRNIATETDESTGKKKRKKRQKNVHFDAAECQAIMLRHSQDEKSYPMPSHPMGFQSFDQCKAAVKQIHGNQLERGANSRAWEMIWTRACKKLHKHAKERLPMVKKMNYAEKVDHEFAACTVVERHEEIEQQFWDDSVAAAGKRSILSNLRHRCCAQHLMAGMLRCESLHRAELSDFVCVKPPMLESDVHPIFLMVTQLPFGKTNHGRKLCGRAARHKHVNLCAVGSVALHLQHRFWCTGEFRDMTAADWADNTKWFNIKFLIDPHSKDTSKEMGNDSHGKHVKNALKKRHIVCNKIPHLGRHVGARLLELLEEESEEMRRMGQWNPSMQDNHYSAKLPMAPIRKLAGYNSAVKMHFNTRTTVKPSQALLEMTPIGQWSHRAFQDVMDLEGDNDHPAALAFLNFMNEMNAVFLQDAAVMQLSGRNHPAFESLPVCLTEECKAFKLQMKEALDTERSPLDANLEKVIPGLHSWHKENNLLMKRLDAKVNDGLAGIESTLKEGLVSVSKSISEQGNRSDIRIAGIFAEVATKLRGSSADMSTLDGDNGLPEVSLTGETIATLPTIGDSLVLGNCDGDVATPLDSTEINWDHPDHRTFFLTQKPATLLDMCKEWHGVGKHSDDCGGAAGREALFAKLKRNKTAWRKHIDNQQFSRTKRLVEAVATHAEANNLTPQEACALLEDHWQQAKRSLPSCVATFQTMGLIQKQKDRGRRARNASTSTATSTTNVVSPTQQLVEAV